MENDYKSKARILERIFSNRINEEWYSHSSDDIERNWFSFISVASGVYLKFHSQYFKEYEANILEFLSKYLKYSSMSFNDFCANHPDVCDAMIRDLKGVIGENAWYEECNIAKELAPEIRAIVHKYHELILSNKDVSEQQYETEIHNIIKQGYIGARSVAEMFYERDEYRMVYLKFYNNK